MFCLFMALQPIRGGTLPLCQSPIKPPGMHASTIQQDIDALSEKKKKRRVWEGPREDLGTTLGTYLEVSCGKKWVWDGLFTYLVEGSQGQETCSLGMANMHQV